MTDYSKWDKFDDEQALQTIDKEPERNVSVGYKELKKETKYHNNVDTENRKHLKNVAAALKSKVCVIIYQSSSIHLTTTLIKLKAAVEKLKAKLKQEKVLKVHSFIILLVFL